MDSMIDDQPAQGEPACPGPVNPLDLEISTRVSLAVLISAPRDCALRLALEVAVGPGGEGASGAVIVHARDSRYLQAALRRAAMPGVGRRAVVVQDVDALDSDQQAALKAAMQDIARHGANACRIIATTSVPLFERVVGGLFDAGLFYRLNTVHIKAGSLSTENAQGLAEWAQLEQQGDHSDEGADE